MPLEQPLLAMQQKQGNAPTIRYRYLQPGDFLTLKAAHAALFPIDYDDNFFHKATNGLDRIWSCAAFVQEPYCEEQLVGFVTAKTVFLHECDVTDRQHMGLLSPIVDHDLILYILTLGVLERYRHQGIASALIQAVCQQASETRCRAVFLHVISYNTAAMSLYSMQGFSCVARLARFYYIATGRQPDPNTVVYDAYLYVQYIGGAGGTATPWDMLTLAWSPLRTALGRIHSCVPGFCRQQPHQQQQQVYHHPHSSALPDSLGAVAVADASRSSSNSITSSYQAQPGVEQAHQQQQQQQQRYPDQHQQPVPPFGAAKFSRQRFNRGGFDSTAHTSTEAGRQTQQQQQQLLSLLPQAARHGLRQQQQQCEHIREAFSSQQQHQQQVYMDSADDHGRQQQQQRPQRMLWWLFNGHSRQGAKRHHGQQQQRLINGGQSSLQGQQQEQQQFQAVTVL